MPKHPICLSCNKKIEGRTDKKYCDPYCKSAYQYENSKKEEQIFYRIDKQLKVNRKILRSHNKLGKTMIRKEALDQLGFDSDYFTHYWKNANGQVYLFCYEYGFLSINDNNKPKYLLIQWQDYMNKKHKKSDSIS